MTHGHLRLDNLGCLKISGADALSFLQGQISCDMSQLSDSHSSLAVYCNLQGRVVASMRCLYFLDAYFCVMPVNMLEKTMTILKKYAMFSKVDIEIDQQMQILGRIQATTDLDFNQARSDVHHIEVGVGLSSARTLLLADENTAAARLTAWSEQEETISLDDWALSEIQDGIVTITAETSEKHVPHRLNFQYVDALNFEKGCYLGQEIVARMHYRGTIKHHCYHVKLKAGEIKGDIVARSGDDVLAVMKEADIDETVEVISLPYSF